MQWKTTKILLTDKPCKASSISTCLLICLSNHVHNIDLNAASCAHHTTSVNVTAVGYYHQSLDSQFESFFITVM